MSTVTHEGVINKRTFHKDYVTTIIKVISGINTVIAVLAIWLVFRAQPVTFAPIERNLGLRTTWDLNLLNYLFYLMILGFIIGVVGLIANSKRLKRKYDHLRVNFIAMVVGSLIGVVVYLIVL